MTDYTWIGASSQTASTAGNWVPSGPPGASDKAIFDAAASQNCNWDIASVNEIEIQSEYNYTVDFTVSVALNGLKVSKASSIKCTIASGLSFLGTPPYKSNSCFVENGTSENVFYDALSRDNLIYSFAHSSGTLYFDTGYYPYVKLGGSASFSPQYVAPTVADSTDVNMLQLTVDAGVGAFEPASTTPTDNDKAKRFLFSATTSEIVIVDGFSAFDGGYATWVFQAKSAGFLIPTSNLVEYNNCTFSFYKMIISATDDGAGAWAKIAQGARLRLNDFTVEVGASVKGAGPSAIHLINRPTIKGTWGFFPVADGIYHHKEGELLGVADGGTGLTSIPETYIPFGGESNALSTSSRLTFDSNLNELTIDGKLTVSGLIDPTGLELTPVAANPGGVDANTLWLDSADSNKLKLGSTEVGGGGGAETDPVFTASPAALITNAGSGDVSQGDTAFGWGDHAGLYATAAQGALADTALQSASDIDISALTANTAIADADLLLLDDGANGTNRKITFTEVKEWIRGDGVLVGRDGGVNELRVRDSRDDGELLPDSVADKTVSFDFTDDLSTYTPSAYWSGVITMKGWGGSYRAFQLLSSASSEGTSAVDTEPLYFRSGEDNVWGAMREVLTFPGTTPNADGAANQVLQTDGAGTLSWVDLPAGGGGTPSGVAGAIQFSDGAAFASDDANLHYDDANNRLGVGTNTPAHTLHVHGVGSYPMRVQANQGNLRMNQYGHLHIQNDNSSPTDGDTIDDPIWSVGQRDGGQFDIAFGNANPDLVSYADQLFVLQRAGNSATGQKQIGFLGATPTGAIDDGAGAALQPILPTLPTPTPNETALAQRLDAILAGLQTLGLFL